MNYKQKLQTQQDLKKILKCPYPEGTVKITTGSSRAHEITKAEVCYWLKVNGYQIWTEVHLPDGKRADIAAINGSNGYLIEILCSETDKRFQEKLQGSYGDFMVIPVNAKTFRYDTFKL